MAFEQGQKIELSDITKANIGLGNVDNTSDINKPISTATQNALNGKADKGHTHNYNYTLIGWIEGTGDYTITLTSSIQNYDLILVLMRHRVGFWIGEYTFTYTDFTNYLQNAEIRVSTYDSYGTFSFLSASSVRVWGGDKNLCAIVGLSIQ